MPKVTSKVSVGSVIHSNPLEKKESEQSLEEQIKHLSPAEKIQMISELIESQLITIQDALDIINPDRKIERELMKSSLGKELL